MRSPVAVETDPVVFKDYARQLKLPSTVYDEWAAHPHLDDNAAPEEQARHYLVVGPWDHSGTVSPKREVGGLKFVPASLLDIPKLATDWYQWTLADGPKPEFLQERVA